MVAVIICAPQPRNVSPIANVKLPRSNGLRHSRSVDWSSVSQNHQLNLAGKEHILLLIYSAIKLESKARPRTVNSRRLHLVREPCGRVLGGDSRGALNIIMAASRFRLPIDHTLVVIPLFARTCKTYS